MSFNRTAVFIDGSNVYAASKKLGIDIDYKRLLKYYGDDLLRAYYYTAVIEDKEEYISIKPLIDWLSYNKYAVVTKAAKTFHDPLTNLTKIKGNMDIEIAVDAMELAPVIDRLVLYSGDGDFTHLIYAMQRRGVKCDVVSTMSMVADELRRAADEFFDLADMVKSIAMQPGEKARSRYG